MILNKDPNIYNALTFAKEASRHCVGMEGNISCKKENSFLIKASGISLATIHEWGLIEMDFIGNQLTNKNIKPSMELGFHKFLLSFPEINYVSHTHPVNTLKILCSRSLYAFAAIRLFPDQVIFNGKESCLVPYAKPGDDLTNMIQTYVQKFISKNNSFPKIILLENHGVIACGKTIKECIIATDICEKAAEIFIGADKLGMSYLHEKQVDDLINDEKEKYRQEQL